MCLLPASSKTDCRSAISMPTSTHRQTRARMAAVMLIACSAVLAGSKWADHDI